MTFTGLQAMWLAMQAAVGVALAQLLFGLLVLAAFAFILLVLDR